MMKNAKNHFACYPRGNNLATALVLMAVAAQKRKKVTVGGTHANSAHLSSLRASSRPLDESWSVLMTLVWFTIQRL